MRHPHLPYSIPHKRRKPFSLASKRGPRKSLVCEALTVKDRPDDRSRIRNRFRAVSPSMPLDSITRRGNDDNLDARTRDSSSSRARCIRPSLVDLREGHHEFCGMSRLAAAAVRLRHCLQTGASRRAATQELDSGINTTLLIQTPRLLQVYAELFPVASKHYQQVGAVHQ